MKKNYLTIYEWDNKKYISGFDYAELKSINMGIDSKMGYYEIDDEIRGIINEKHLEIKNIKLNEKEIFRIRNEYFDEMGDVKSRIKRASLSDLNSWKKSSENLLGTELYNEVVYNMILKEINERDSINKEKEEVMDRMLIYMDILKEEFGKDLIMECLSELLNRMNEKVSSRKRA